MEHVYKKIPIRDFPDETPPTNVFGNFAEHTEAWSVEQRFSWFAAVSIMEIWNAIFTILTLLTLIRRPTNRPAPSPAAFSRVLNAIRHHPDAAIGGRNRRIRMAETVDGTFSHPNRHEPRAIKDLQDTYRKQTRPRNEMRNHPELTER